MIYKLPLVALHLGTAKMHTEWALNKTEGTLLITVLPQHHIKQVKFKSECGHTSFLSRHFGPKQLQTIGYVPDQHWRDKQPKL